MGLEAIMEIKVLRFGMSSSSRKHSKSFSDKKRLAKDGSDTSPDFSHCKRMGEKPGPGSGTHSSLKQEIPLLEKRLQDQFKVRHALEMALGERTSCRDHGSDSVSMSEVAYLEQYLLTLYRKALDQQLLMVSPQSNENPRDSCRYSQKKASRSSQPLSMLECARKSETSIVSLAEYLGTNIYEHVPKSPNKLLEDMVRCMSAIYCKLADSSPGHQGSSSPFPFSSKSGFSPWDQPDLCSPGFRNDSLFEILLDNSFRVEGLKEFSGLYSKCRGYIEMPRN